MPDFAECNVRRCVADLLQSQAPVWREMSVWREQQFEHIAPIVHEKG